MQSREEAVALWREHNADPSLWKHALAVEATMRRFAESSGEDAELWARAGLLHDLDYERHPTEHLHHTEAPLAAAGYDAAFIRAVLSHGYGRCNDVKPETGMEKTLYAIDELTGFVTACALVRPSKSLLDLETKSVKKKWGTTAFAAGVDRGVIERGAEMLGVGLDQLIGETILAMRTVAADLGLAGNQ